MASVKIRRLAEALALAILEDEDLDPRWTGDPDWTGPGLFPPTNADIDWKKVFDENPGAAPCPTCENWWFPDPGCPTCHGKGWWYH